MDLETAALKDRLDVRETVERYSFAVTVRDWDMLARVFHPDAEWKVNPPMNHLVQGRDAIVTLLRDAIATYDFLVQRTHQVMIQLNGDEAAAQVVISEEARKADHSVGMVMNSLYRDRLVRFEGGWVFSHRHFLPITLDCSPPAGNVLWTPGTSPGG